MKPGPLTAPAPRSFTPGPPVVPTAQAVAFLDAAGDVEVRLPLRVELEASRPGAVRTWLGQGADQVPVSCDDSRLGIGLADRARALPPGGGGLWVVGRWRAGARLQLHVIESAVRPEETWQVGVAR